jgi:hypothetical protein
MPINVKGLFETLQYKANNIDSSTSTAEILDTLKAIKLADGNTIISYDSDGAFPDASTTNVKLGYNKQTGKIKFNNGTWDILTISLDGTNVPTYGYISGGTPSTNVIDKFPFQSDANAVDVGDLTSARYQSGGASSSTDGYTHGGVGGVNIIDKFPFSTDGNAVDVGDLSSGKSFISGTYSTDNGYAVGGTPTAGNVIQKYAFATDGNATDVGDLVESRLGIASQRSTTHGYASGGYVPITFKNYIEKYSFSADGNATDVGDLTYSRDRGTGNSSSTHGYTVSGRSPNPAVTNAGYDKFSFASDGNATDVADYTGGAYCSNAGTSSGINGYLAGGSDPVSPTTYNKIHKYSFATEGDTTEIGDLTVARRFGAGQRSGS